MDDGFDLDAYLRRIAYEGPREPSLGTLRAIVAAHSTAIPFENIDVLLKHGVSLDIATLHNKLVQRRRGGYCFEQNTLLAAALRALGFSLVTLAARVVRGMPEGFATARAHMLLQVDLPEGPFIADVGYGTRNTARAAQCGQGIRGSFFRAAATKENAMIKAGEQSAA